MTNLPAILRSAITTAIVVASFIAGLAALPNSPVSIPASWVVYAAGVITVGRTALVALNPRDPSFGIGATPPEPTDDIAGGGEA